jgi:hypothetical protein
MAHLARRPNVAPGIYHEALTGGAHLCRSRAWIQLILAHALGDEASRLAGPT